MSFNGKWALSSAEGLDAFIDATGADKEKLAHFRDALEMTGPNGYVEELKVEDDKLSRKVYIGGQLKKDRTVPLNTVVDGESWDGSPSKLIVKIEGNKLIRDEQIAHKKITTVVEASGDTASMVMRSCGATYARNYQKM